MRGFKENLEQTGQNFTRTINKKRPQKRPLFKNYSLILPPADGLVCCKDHIYQGIIIRVVYIKVKAVAFSSFRDDFYQFLGVV
jgi:hypothetical protein